MSLGAALPLTIISALLYGACFPPWSARVLAWIALVPLLAVLRRTTTVRAVLLMWFWSLLMSQVVAFWLPGSVANYYDRSLAVGIGVALTAETLQVAVHYMAFALYYRLLPSEPHPLRPLLAAAGWAAAEFSRVQLFWGNPLAVLGYSQANFTSLVQIANATGVYGVSFVVMAANEAVLELLVSWKDQARRRAAFKAAAVAALPLVAAFSYGRLTLRGADEGASDDVQVAIVQPSLDLGSQWRADLYGKNLDEYLALTRSALATREPRLVVWPENAMSFFLEEEDGYRAKIADTLRPFDAELLAGGPRTTPSVAPLYYNSAYLISPTGGLIGRYDKRVLLPLAEYFPFDSMDFLRRRFGRLRVFTPGAVTAPLSTAAGNVGVLICNEAMFPQLAAEHVRAGDALLVNLANDTWLGADNWGRLVFDIVSLRAVEQRRFVIRASTSGPSGIIDPYGRVLASTTPAQVTTLAGGVRPLVFRTIYSEIGDAFAWACVGVAIGSILYRGNRRGS